MFRSDRLCQRDLHRFGVQLTGSDKQAEPKSDVFTHVSLSHRHYTCARFRL